MPAPPKQPDPGMPETLRRRIHELQQRHHENVERSRDLERMIAAVAQEVDDWARKAGDGERSGCAAKNGNGATDLRGSILRCGDVVSPVDESWDAER